ncbi:MAG TPA: GNAT family N-acetyltransferase [Solirubrobacterales bacterium]|nr:GNAT family N-acetyltransferase [Solirubrobacterales bacterium]
MRIRRATPSDAERLARLLRDFDAEYEGDVASLETLEGRYRTLLEAGEVTALLIDDAAGFAQLRFRPSVYGDYLDAYLEELYVVPERRGEGLGRALLSAAMETARGAGAARIDLGTSEEDEAARHLYESAGFTNREGRPDGPVMLYYERDL